MKLKITDYTLSDLLASTELPIEVGALSKSLRALEAIDCWAVEVANKRTFENSLNQGQEPWAAISKLVAATPNTCHQMCLNGQYLLGDQQFSDDLVFKFIDCAVAAGIDMFLIEDPLNDTHNMRAAIQAAKAHEKLVSVKLHYCNPKSAYYLALAKELEYLNVDALCISDEGLLTPYRAYDLISKLKNSTHLPIHLLSSQRGDLAMATTIKAVEASVDGLASTLPWRPESCDKPSLHALNTMLSVTNKNPAIDPQDIYLACEALTEDFSVLSAAYSNNLNSPLSGSEANNSHARQLATDYRVLRHQISPSTFFALTNKLAKKDLARLLDESLSNLKKIITDLGSIPLQPPLMDIVLEQAIVMTLQHGQTTDKNDAAGHYINASDGFRRLCAGHFGVLKAKAESEIASLIASQTVVTHRPADTIASEYGSVFSKLSALSLEHNFNLSDDKRGINQEILNFAMLPQASLAFFKPQPRLFASPQAQAEDLVTQLKAAVELKAQSEQMRSNVQLKNRSQLNNNKELLTNKAPLNIETLSVEKESSANVEFSTQDYLNRRLAAAAKLKQDSGQIQQVESQKVLVAGELTLQSEALENSSDNLIKESIEPQLQSQEPFYSDDKTQDARSDVIVLGDDNIEIETEVKNEVENHVKSSANAIDSYLSNEVLAHSEDAVESVALNQSLDESVAINSKLSEQRVADEQWQSPQVKPQAIEALYEVNIDDQDYVVALDAQGGVQVVDSIRSWSSTEAGEQKGLSDYLMHFSSSSVVAPMDGKIAKLFVEKGDYVKQGDLLLVLDVMKMETQLFAHHDAQIVDVVVEEGASVIAQQTLIFTS